VNGRVRLVVDVYGCGHKSDTVLAKRNSVCVIVYSFDWFGKGVWGCVCAIFSEIYRMTFWFIEIRNGMEDGWGAYRVLKDAWWNIWGKDVL
jgi:hypothetical protein